MAEKEAGSGEGVILEKQQLFHENGTMRYTGLVTSVFESPPWGQVSPLLRAGALYSAETVS